MQDTASDRTPRTVRGARLTRHADYQRVYQHSRKQFSASMTYFHYLRPESDASILGPRVGLTAGRVLGNAVVRNRIKRRMREAVRENIGSLRSNVDVVLHPRKSVAMMDFAKLTEEVARVFSLVEAALKKAQP